MNHNTNLQIKNILLNEDSLVVEYTYNKLISEKEETITLFGKNLKIDTNHTYKEFNNSVSTKLSNSYIQVIEKFGLDKFKEDPSLLEITFRTTSAIRSNLTVFENDSQIIDLSWKFANSKHKTFNDRINIEIREVVISNYVINQIIERILGEKYPNHSIYTYSEVSIYKRFPFLLIGSFTNDNKIYYYEQSAKLDFITEVYEVEQPDYYRNFNFIGIIPDNKPLSQIKESDVIKLENNEEYLQFITNEVAKLN